MDEDFIQPMYELSISNFWDILYFGIVNPIAYIGSTLTLLLMVEILRYKRTIFDLLIGILAINDFCLVMFCFTPTVIAQVVDHWFGESICYMYAILNKFFIGNIFCALVFMSVERWWAICITNSNIHNNCNFSSYNSYLLD